MQSEASKQRARERSAQWRRDNPERFRATMRACRQKNGRAYHLKKAYDMTVEQYDAMVAAQGGKCGGCQRELKLVVDHNHITGDVRGLLCMDCNTALGYAHDNPAALRALADYLEKK